MTRRSFTERRAAQAELPAESFDPFAEKTEADFEDNLHLVYLDGQYVIKIESLEQYRACCTQGPSGVYVMLDGLQDYVSHFSYKKEAATGAQGDEGDKFVLVKEPAQTGQHRHIIPFVEHEDDITPDIAPGKAKFQIGDIFVEIGSQRLHVVDTETASASAAFTPFLESDSAVSLSQVQLHTPQRQPSTKKLRRRRQQSTLRRQGSDRSRHGQLTPPLRRQQTPPQQQQHQRQQQEQQHLHRRRGLVINSTYGWQQPMVEAGIYVQNLNHQLHVVLAEEQQPGEGYTTVTFTDVQTARLLQLIRDANAEEQPPSTATANLAVSNPNYKAMLSGHLYHRLNPRTRKQELVVGDRDLEGQEGLTPVPVDEEQARRLVEQAQDRYDHLQATYGLFPNEAYRQGTPPSLYYSYPTVMPHRLFAYGSDGEESRQGEGDYDERQPLVPQVHYTKIPARKTKGAGNALLRLLFPGDDILIPHPTESRDVRLGNRRNTGTTSCFDICLAAAMIAAAAEFYFHTPSTKTVIATTAQHGYNVTTLLGSQSEITRLLAQRAQSTTSTILRVGQVSRNVWLGFIITSYAVDIVAEAALMYRQYKERRHYLFSAESRGQSLRHVATRHPDGNRRDFKGFMVRTGLTAGSFVLTQTAGKVSQSLVQVASDACMESPSTDPRLLQRLACTAVRVLDHFSGSAFDMAATLTYVLVAMAAIMLLHFITTRTADRCSPPSTLPGAGRR